MKTIEEVLEFLYELQGFNREYRFDAVKKALKLIGNPHENLKTVLVAGTNGKGSVCHCISSVLKNAGYKTGLFTSPHLIRFNERIVVDTEEISDESIVRLALVINEKIGDLKFQIGFFGFVFCICMLHFYENKIDIGVIEVGLGGRLDPTNSLSPLISIVTNIDLDHTGILGNSVEEIAFEKTGIIKDNTAVSGIKQKHLWHQVKEKTKNSYFFGRDFNVNVKSGNLYSQSIEVITSSDNYLIETNLSGTYQKYNLALAVFACELLNRFNYKIQKKCVISGLKKIPIHGRFETFKIGNVVVILDGGHNPAGILELNKSIKGLLRDSNYVLLCGISTGRNPAMLKEIASGASKVIFTQASYKAVEFNKNTDLFDCEIVQENNVSRALELALNAASKCGFLLITGSLYLVGDVLKEAVLRNS